MKNKKLIIGAVVIVLVVLLGIKGKGLLEQRKSEVASTPLPKDISPSVRVIYASQGALDEKVSFLAQVFSDKSIKLSTKMAGFVEKVLVRESMKVKKGDLLVSIDDAELRASLDALKATYQAQKSDLEMAKSIYARNQKLYEVGGLAQEALHMSLVALTGKKALLENSHQKIVQVKHQRSYLQIVAPFDGEIDALFLHEGDLAAAGKPILSMSNGTKKLVFSYSPKRAKDIQTSQSVFLDGEEVGKIGTLYTQSNNGLLRGEVTLVKPVDLVVGSSVNIEVLLESSRGCVVPENTLLHKKEGTFVLAYKEGSFHALKVDVLASGDSSIMISPCPDGAIAQASEVKLAQLPVFKDVHILGARDE